MKCRSNSKRKRKKKWFERSVDQIVEEWDKKNMGLERSVGQRGRMGQSGKMGHFKY